MYHIISFLLTEIPNAESSTLPNFFYNSFYMEAQ